MIMKRSSYRLRLMRLIRTIFLVIVLINPASAAFASSGHQPASAQNTIIASAVIVPAQVVELGFLISALAREIPVEEGDIVKTGQTLMVLDTPDLQFAVIETQAALRSAQVYAELQKYQTVENRRKGKIFIDPIPEVYRERANVKVQQAQAALEIAQFNLIQGTLTAPFEGTVTSIKVIPGEFVPSDQAVVTLATLNTLQVETTDLSERDIAEVQLGAPVNIMIQALHEDVSGKVIGISPKADTEGGDVVFKVTIAFDQQPKNALWGMTAAVNIEK